MPMKPLGYILYEGASVIDGSPIVCIVNKVDSASANDKTGSMAQTFIIRSDIPPMSAVQSGADSAVCGECKHRPSLARLSGEAPCYVQVGKSVQSVYHAYKRGSYTRATPAEIGKALSGKLLRLGTYGDPYAVPVAFWKTILAKTAGHSGYTHQWTMPGFDYSAWAPLVMASADSPDEAALANLFGMRVFRVSIGVDRQPGEVTCPASAEGGRKTTCANCLLCAGTSKSARDIVIADHAAGHSRRIAIHAVSA